MDLLRSLGLFLGWLSGALAGVTACVFAFGYVITAANLRMLGLTEQVVRYDPSIYVIRGSIFLWDIASVVLHNGSVLAIFAVLVLAVCWPLYRYYAPLAERAGSWIAKRGYASRRGIVVTLYAAIFGLMALAFDAYYYPSLDQSGDRTGLLFARNCLAGPADARSDCLEALSPAADHGAAAAGFDNFLYATLLALALVPAAWSLTATMRYRIIWFLPFALVALAFANLLLTMYGAFRFENKFYEISIVADADARPRPAPLFIINRTSEELILWDPVGAEVLWLPTQSVTEARIGRGWTLDEIRRSLQRASP